MSIPKGKNEGLLQILTILQNFKRRKVHICCSDTETMLQCQFQICNLSQSICLAALKMHGRLSGCAGTFKGTDWPSFHPWPCSWSPIIGAYCIKCWAHECSATWTKELCWNFSCPRTGKSLFNNLLYRLSGLYSWSLTMNYDVTTVWSFGTGIK